MIKDFDYSRRFEREGSVVVLDLVGGVFASNVADFRRAMEESLESDAGNLILNCSKLDFLGSSAIGALIEFSDEYRRRGKCFRMVCLSRDIRNVLSKLCIDTLLDIHGTEREALEKMPGGG